VTRRHALAWVRLFAGLWLFAAGVVLGLRSGLGVSPWDVLHDGIRQVTVPRASACVSADG
jgi:uncharacterized protein